MKYSSKTGSLRSLKGGCVALTVEQAKAFARDAELTSLLDANLGEFKDEPGQTARIRLPKPASFSEMIVVGTGSDSLTPRAYRKVADSLTAALAASTSATALVTLTGVGVTDADSYWKTLTLVTRIELGTYRFDRYKTRNTTPVTLRQVQLLTDGRARTQVASAIRHGRALASGLALARNLGNEPPNVCNPTYLAREARKLGKQPNTRVTVLDERRMKELGMGAFLAVSQGSATPGRMIIVQYKGGKASDAPIALVGKGITFDSGGISIKPAPAMDEMKFDMCGAATVLGTTQAVIEARLPINLICVVAAAENLPSGTATRPGDIVTSLSGQTVEILNTDAEGRLVLCDAITYVQRFKPAAIVDVATLTGAAIIALGSHATALYSNRDSLAAELLAASERSGDGAWRMPLWEEYQSQLKSPFADLANVGGREAGSVTAACFLANFAKDVAWAHLDIAGSGFQGGAKKGASGRPVPLLFQFLLTRIGS